MSGTRAAPLGGPSFSGRAAVPETGRGYFTYFATFRAAVAWEMPSSLATATVVPQRR